jgi:hypothetical protein
MKARWIILVFLGLVSLCFLISLHVLQIKALREDKVVFMQIVHPNDRFEAGYIHSVERCPVGEFFRIDETFRIILYETTFASSNTGLPSAASGNETFHNEGDFFRISNMERVLPELLLWVHKDYENTLKIGNSPTVRLPSLAGNTLLQVLIKKMTLFEYAYLKGKICFIQYNGN